MLIVGGPAGGLGHERRGHPERPARVDAVMAGLDELQLGTELVVVEAEPAGLAQLHRVHDPAYLETLMACSQAGGGMLDADTYATADSWAVAGLAAGAGLAAIDALRRSDDGVAFVVARPPGHHALRERAMGFCLLNNIAVATAELTAAGERVLIVDWDVHHGNGTQAIFWDDPNVLYVSTHQWPFYPGSGAADETGGTSARGLTVNVPLPPGATGDVVRRAIDDIAAPVIEGFEPTWVLVSAGFDAHRADPLAALALSSGDFAQLATTVAAFAPRPGRLALFLEGGYDLEALRLSVAATVSALLGGSHRAEAPTAGGPGVEYLHQASAARREALGRGS